MTLNTSVYIKDEISPLTVFTKCRELLGATDEHKARFSESYDKDGSWWLGNEMGQGLPALLDIKFRIEGPLGTSEQYLAHTEWCEPDCDLWHHEPPCWLEVTFDTTYGYRENGEGCGHLHVRLLVALGTWLDSLGIGWIWENEFTGERHEGYDQLPELAGGGEKAAAWFAEVMPAIVAISGERRNRD